MDQESGQPRHEGIAFFEAPTARLGGRRLRVIPGDERRTNRLAKKASRPRGSVQHCARLRSASTRTTCWPSRRGWQDEWRIALRTFSPARTAGAPSCGADMWTLTAGLPGVHVRGLPRRGGARARGGDHVQANGSCARLRRCRPRRTSRPVLGDLAMKRVCSIAEGRDP